MPSYNIQDGNEGFKRFKTVGEGTDENPYIPVVGINVVPDVDTTTGWSDPLSDTNVVSEKLIKETIDGQEITGASYDSNTGDLTLTKTDGNIIVNIPLSSNNTYITNASFNTSDGVLTLTLNDASTVSVDLDGRYLENIIEDLTPQLGGNLDLNNQDINGTGNINITGEVTATTLIGDMRGATIFQAKAGEALTKGDPVYISGDDITGNKPIVSIADADDANKMPCFGLANETVSINANVNVVTFGTISGLDTSSYNQGDILYISTTGTLTATKPSGESSLIQNIGKVMRSHASTGSIKVGGAGRTNDVPNLNDGNVFIGNASNQAETRALTLDDISETATNKHFTASDETKLNGIETGATADQTAGEIKTAYESNADTNAFTDAEKTKLAGIETNADVTDAINVDSAGAVMNTDTSTASMSFVIDEDTMVSNSETKVPTQQSVKAYVDANSGGIDPRNSFTQNSGQYIATEGIRARDVGGIAILNDEGTAGVAVYDNGDVDIITKMSASEIKARNVNGLKLHDDGGNGLLVKDGGDVEVTTKILSSEVKAKDANGLKLHDDGGNGLTVHDGGNISHNTTLNSASFNIDGNTSTDGTFLIRSLKPNTPATSHIHYGANADWFIRSGNLSGKVIIQDAGGYCGVGTSNPGVKLEVSSQDSCTFAVNKNSNYPANGVAARFQNESGAHSWGVVAEFRVNGSAGTDRPSILFSHGYSSTTWSLGIAGYDDNFRIRQNHGYRNSSWGTVRFYIGTNGDVGVGTENPGAKFHVAGNIRGSKFIDNQNTNRFIDASGTSQLGSLVVNGNLTVSGSVSKGGGSFDIPHPSPEKKDTHRLRHYFVETPSAGGNIYKYQVDCNEGDNYIDLPDYFQHLNKDSLVWANPFKHFGRAWGEVIEGGKRAKIVVEQSGIYNILIFGDRKDAIAMQEFEKYGVEYEIKEK
jgi:hypothetical protein